MDVSVILEVLLVLVVAASSVFLGKFLATKGVTTKDLELTNLLNGALGDAVLNSDKAKEVSRLIGAAITYVELYLTDKPNQVKEDAAYVLISQALTDLDLGTPLKEDFVRGLIRLAVAFSESTYSKGKTDFKALFGEQDN